MSEHARSGASHNPYPVDPTGCLIGSFAAAVLYGCHTAQVYRYYAKFRQSDPWRLQVLVGWIYAISSLQHLIIVATAWKYYVDGMRDPKIWEELWWPSAIQDGLIPIVAFTAQCYFGRRAYILLGRRTWFLWLVAAWSSATALCGIALAATAYAWAHTSSAVAVPSQIVTILWMGLSASLDGFLTAILIQCLWRSRSPSMDWTNNLIRRTIALTLETVLVTHICGAVLCVTFLSQPAQHRTRTTAFWICLEIITELYALSVVFTINARSSARRSFRVASTPPVVVDTHHAQETIAPASQVPTNVFVDPRRLDFAVEGIQEISRFSYHFPGTKKRSAAVGKREEVVGNGRDDLQEPPLLPMRSEPETVPMEVTKDPGS